VAYRGAFRRLVSAAFRAAARRFRVFAALKAASRRVFLRIWRQVSHSQPGVALISTITLLWLVGDPYGETGAQRRSSSRAA
jgi:hypothetical protein